MIELINGAWHLSVHAIPGARRTLVGGNHAAGLRVAVTAPPDKGKANKAIIKALSDALQVPKSQIELIRGTTSRRKVFAITGAPDSLPDRVARLAAIS